MATEGLVRSYGALLIGALVPIYTAAHSSIQVPKSVKKKWRELDGKGKRTAEEKDEEEEETEVERLTTEDAYLFPILGSFVLFGLFLAFKYLDKSFLNRILGGYLAIMGTGALGRTLADVTKQVLGDKRSQKMDKYNLTLNKNKEEQFKLSFTRLHIFSCIGALALTFAQQYTQHWLLSNILALSFAYSAISLFYLDSFTTASILLAGLFFYDIWWVFGSKAVFGDGADVMVSVAKNFDAPIKIVFPKDLSAAKDFTLLGLGDIVLPGAFLALSLRFDYHQAIKRALSSSKRPPRPTDSFSKPYFTASFIAYIGGLATTILVMHTFKAAQPALLYLSPACIGSVTLLALVRGESKELWGWEDGEEERKERERKEKEAETTKKDKEKSGSDAKKRDTEEKSSGDEISTVETTSIEVDGGRVLRSRTSKTD
ncbi:aspartic endopeptidase [Sporobolomyces salmoneus]|uniref:aspartic endopeptidase n=1 Tax=Sporobolomyces salmoneus TaxID=183962 RepID=UPI00317AE5A8